MVQRLISANASEIKRMSKEELFQSIKASEGRVILSENVVVHPSVAVISLVRKCQKHMAQT